MGNFNPRTHMGCDWETLTLTEERGKISIHAPTWGATTSGSQAWLIGAFQSTHPHGVRLGVKPEAAYNAA